MNFVIEELPKEKTIAGKCKEKGTYTDFGFIRVSPTNCILPAIYQYSLQNIRNFAVREDDIFMISNPKCGTTWSMEMVWLLGNDLDFEGAKSSLNQRFPHIDIEGCIAKKMQESFGGGSMLEKINKMETQRFIKSHLPKELLPMGLWQVKPKIIFIVRNPKDAAVSNFYHYKLFHGYTGTLDEFLEATLDEEVMYSPFWEHAIEFWKMRHEPNVLFLTYEEMKENLESVIQRTSDFLGKSIDPDQMQRLKQHLSFEKMKNNSAVNYDDVIGFIKEQRGVELNEGSFIREGTVGGGEKKMSAEIVKRFDEWTKRKVSGTGLDEIYCKESKKTEKNGTGKLKNVAFTY